MTLVVDSSAVIAVIFGDDDADAAALAITAWRRFGKGRHAASLNLDDYCSYATAKSAGAPLLYKWRRLRPDRHRQRALR
ncbi:MAG: type II toxin-antitoxin system VapC family toxin [Dermatophilaceae bacterium]